jgi:hypothetical protein
MQTIRGSIQGTGAAFYLCLGGVPSKIRLWNLEDATNFEQEIHWEQLYTRTAKGFDGFQKNFVAAAVSTTDIVAGSGIAAYEGGDTTDGTETYIGADAEPNKFNKGAGDDIDTWTLGNVTNKTGNWNAVANITAGPHKVGIGSVMKIDSGKGAQPYVITAQTGNGEAANEVTLNVGSPSGKITFLGGMYTFVQMASGLVAPKGIYCALAATINVDTEMMGFEAVID